MRWNRCVFALALLVFLPARADEGAVKASPGADAKPADTKKGMRCCAGEEGADKALCPKEEVKKAGNMVVTRDPETGELRNATAAERAKLFAGRAPQASGAAPRVIVLPDGTKMVHLGEDAMNYAIAAKAPDGSIKQSCVHGAQAATEARTAPSPAPAPRAEER